MSEHNVLFKELVILSNVSAVRVEQPPCVGACLSEMKTAKEWEEGMNGSTHRTKRRGNGRAERRQSYLRLESTLARTTEALPAFGDKDSRIWRALPRLREPSPSVRPPPPMAVAPAQHQKFAATSRPPIYCHAIYFPKQF